MTPDELFEALVMACQSYGYTTDATYDALHAAVDSIVAVEPDKEN